MQVRFEHVRADYQLGPIRTANVINDISAELPTGTFTAIIGHTGAGKSSLLKLINGLLLPTAGEVHVGGLMINVKGEKQILNQVRKRVGMVFQFPEAQLFAETVEQDIAFGPINFGFTPEQTKQAVRESLDKVGLSADLLERSPFSLSGGQQRRVAIAGIMATSPDVLVLDEPGAGLDPEGRKKILSMLKCWHNEHKATTLLVTHDMDDVATYADNVLVLDHGRVASYQSVRQFFSDEDRLSELAIDMPEPLRVQRRIEQEKGIKLSQVSLTRSELAANLIKEQLL
ncbi:energy-coupling factor transporter ATPase [Amphibacillus cookii]|uniref:energy-coupling factor transporter ATPase n=1 Tax=Amphibacillus cookii TaxID=767787 RepID=UPI00195B9657|nr:energy-coupling factor transporter ATPase [Amphibacillus cookii]MBM7543191.1 energy-coupling factor transport system ATP-binding protein [Amphibacillus cookii]